MSALLWWLVKDFPIPISARVPGMDDRPKMAVRSDSVIIGEFLTLLGKWMLLRPAAGPDSEVLILTI